MKMSINVIFNKTDYEISERKRELWDKYNKIIQWGRMHPLRFAEIFLGLQFTDHQKYVFMSTWQAKFAVWVMGRNSGKCLSLDTPVYSVVSDRGEKYPKKTIGDLKVGDKIYDEQGKLTEVIHLNSIIIEDVYEIEFEDGEIIECNREHLWSVYDRYFRKHKEDKIPCLRNTEFLYDNIQKEKQKNKIEHRFHVSCTKPIDYPKTSVLPIDPYVLGLWLGDGSHGANTITVGTEDFEVMTNSLRQHGVIYTYYKEKEPKNCYRVSLNPFKKLKEQGMSSQQATANSFLNKIKKLNLYKNKHIPECYMYAPLEDRIELLKGLFDTDGCVNKDGTCEFTQTRYELIKQVSQLLDSVGVKNTICHKVTNYMKTDGTLAETYRIAFRCDKQMPLFSLPRKVERLPEKLNPAVTKKAIVDVRKTRKKKAMRCITVSNDSGLFLCGNHATVTHNSFLSAPYIMTRSILIPNHKTYIMSVTGNQSQETFKKMEDLAMGQIASVSGSTSVFLNELVKQNSGASGFVHDKNSYSCELYNGSEVHSLNSVAKNIVGIRSNLNFYDEAGKIERDFFALTKPFTTQDTNFIAGKGINVDCYPLQFPNQIILASSAEDIFTELWDSYLLGAKEMIMGNKDYFVCDIDCRFSLAPKMNGEPFKPLLTQAVIDDAIAKNEFRANREYFNKFDVSGGQDCLVNKGTLNKCSYGYYPSFKYEDGKKYVIVYDPSSKLDNSVILVAELFHDEEKGWMAKIINCRNLIENKKGGGKKIIQKPDQIEILKEMLLDYNGPALDYENIEKVIIDAGAGGGGFDISQFLLPGWEDSHRKKHVGIIDLEDKYCLELQDRFPEAKNILTLANFTKDKVKMYEMASDALNQGLIIFPKNANGQNEMEMEEIGEDGEPVFRYEKLVGENLRAITEIEMLKYELMAMQKMKNTQTNKISFDLIPSKKNEGLHDDRADCMAMLCNFLMELRATDKMNAYKKEKKDYSALLTQKKKISSNNNLFGGVNPFASMGANPFMS